jgi:hypothetical protein
MPPLVWRFVEEIKVKVDRHITDWIWKYEIYFVLFIF